MDVNCLLPVSSQEFVMPSKIYVTLDINTMAALFSVCTWDVNPYSHCSVNRVDCPVLVQCEVAAYHMSNHCFGHHNHGFQKYVWSQNLGIFIQDFVNYQEFWSLFFLVWEQQLVMRLTSLSELTEFHCNI